MSEPTREDIEMSRWRSMRKLVAECLGDNALGLDHVNYNNQPKRIADALNRICLAICLTAPIPETESVSSPPKGGL
jgi:hypothetical protein